MKLESPMFPYAVFCVLLTMTCIGESADHNTVVERHPNNARNDVQGDSALTRRTRALGDSALKRRTRAMGYLRVVNEGMNVLRKLLSGAQQLPSPPSNSEKIREYVKQGSYSRAFKDFNSVDPKRVHVGEKYTRGEVADRTLYLTKDGGNGKPVLEIKRKKFGARQYSDRITYID